MGKQGSLLRGDSSVVVRRSSKPLDVGMPYAPERKAKMDLEAGLQSAYYNFVARHV